MTSIRGAEMLAACAFVESVDEVPAAGAPATPSMAAAGARPVPVVVACGTADPVLCAGQAVSTASITAGSSRGNLIMAALTDVVHEA